MSSTIIIMSPAELASIALMMAAVFSAAASVLTSANAILSYRNIQRNRRETGSISVVPPSISTRHPRAFAATVITQCLVAIGSAIPFVALMQEHEDPWPTYLSSSIIISSMIRDMLIASHTSDRIMKIKTIMLVETLAMIASTMALRTESSAIRHLILSNAFGAHDLFVCLISVAEKLWTKSFRREPRSNLLPRILRTPRPRASSPGGSSQIRLRTYPSQAGVD
ncbi:hypothetical protein B0T10DRAFT_467938 [Thelonectria olida]|uniref:Uncharacterized protein n=1 Tax=Thelonectria olida TaxID=1576542 RepID=A0A9P8VLQ8_9HYPO|nr:hypothetical protein B0T10DRAFT_467938 [Thelonectria olida]